MVKREKVPVLLETSVNKRECFMNCYSHLKNKTINLGWFYPKCVWRIRKNYYKTVHVEEIKAFEIMWQNCYLKTTCNAKKLDYQIIPKSNLWKTQPLVCQTSSGKFQFFKCQRFDDAQFPPVFLFYFVRLAINL